MIVINNENCNHHHAHKCQRLPCRCSSLWQCWTSRHILWVKFNIVPHNFKRKYEKEVILTLKFLEFENIIHSWPWYQTSYLKCFQERQNKASVKLLFSLVYTPTTVWGRREYQESGKRDISGINMIKWNQILNNNIILFHLQSKKSVVQITQDVSKTHHFLNQNISRLKKSTNL